MVARRPSLTTHFHAHRSTAVHSLMPGLIRTRTALATRRKETSSGGKNSSGGGRRPELTAADDSATDPLDDSTSAHRRMDLLLAAKSSPPSSPKHDDAAAADELRVSTASTVPSTVVDEFSIRSSSADGTPKSAPSSAAAPPEEEVPNEEESPIIRVRHAGESARLTPAPTPAPTPAVSTSTSTSSRSGSPNTDTCSSSRRRPLKSAMAHTACPEPAADTSTSTSAPQPPTKKSVQFSNLEIRTYPVTLGDNPSVSSGPPLTLDWNYTSIHTFSVETYEGQRPLTSRRKLSEMALPQSLRIELLCEDARISLRTIAAQCREVERSKKQRRRTVQSLNSAWLCRAVKKMTGVRERAEERGHHPRRRPPPPPKRAI